MNEAAASEAESYIRVTLVQPEAAMEHWHYCFRPLVEDALKHSPLASDTPEAVLEKVMNARASLLQIDDGQEMLACAVCELAAGKEGPLLHVYALAGQGMDDYLDELIMRLRGAAEKMGAVGISMTGRPGWIKTLPAYGFHTQLVTMTLGI